MEHEQIRTLIWEELVLSSSSLSASDLAAACGLDLARVLSPLSSLRQARLVTIASPLPDPRYLPSVQMDAMRWAQALELGIPLSVLEKHARLSHSVRHDALRIATDGTLERQHRQHRQDRQDTRRALLEGRAATTVAATDLARIESDARRALLSNALDPLARAVLQAAQQHASQAMEVLRLSLLSSALPAKLAAIESAEQKDAKGSGQLSDHAAARPPPRSPAAKGSTSRKASRAMAPDVEGACVSSSIRHETSS